jgi:heavy metal sensor kinase
MMQTMIDFLKYRIPIRIRLTLWYALLMAGMIAALVIYLTAQLQGSLRDSVDKSLQRTVSKTIAELDQTEFHTTSRLSFGLIEESSRNSSGFALRLVSPQGKVWDTVGEARSIRDWGTVAEGYSTYQGIGDEDDEWRALSQPILDADGNTIGWVQAAQSLGAINETIFDLQEQALLGIPFIAILMGFGGYFLANRALRPIQRITNAAQEITAQDLSRRLDYDGPKDEVGNLAETFDQMIARLGSSFERERQFTSDAAHELRTPLTILKGHIDVTLSRPRNSAEYEDKLHELSTQVDRLIRLSNALLFLSRSDQNQISINRSRVNLKELLEILLEQIQPLADEKKIQVITNIQKDLFCSGDNDHLIRLFMNVLENALKYTPVNGQIGVTGKKDATHLAVDIHNTGSFIPDGQLSRLFERFYRVDSDRSSQTGGSGLGLAIAQEIARLHGGEILSQSETGEGVTFSVRLPLGNNSS